MRKVYRVTLDIADHATLRQIAGYRGALRAAPARPHMGDPDMQFELWYEIDDQLMEFPPADVHVYVEGTGQPFEHDGEYVSTFSSTSGLLIWHVYTRAVPS